MPSPRPQAHRRDGTVAVHLLEHAAAGRMATWIGDVQVTPRLRTPLEREPSA